MFLLKQLIKEQTFYLRNRFQHDLDKANNVEISEKDLLDKARQMNITSCKVNSFLVPSFFTLTIQGLVQFGNFPQPQVRVRQAKKGHPTRQGINRPFDKESTRIQLKLSSSYHTAIYSHYYPDSSCPTIPKLTQDKIEISFELTKLCL